MLILEPGVVRSLEAHACSGYPNEVCGLLLGRVEGSDGHRLALSAEAAANRERQRPQQRYDLDPADYLRIEQLARARRMEVVGVYHSHPDHPCVPSEVDRLQARAIWQEAPSWSYLILQVTGGRLAARRSWILRGGTFEEETVRSSEEPLPESSSQGRRR